MTCKAMGEKQKAIVLTEQALKIFDEIESPGAVAAPLARTGARHSNEKLKNAPRSTQISRLPLQ